MSDIVERLREPNGKGVNALGHHPLINPDGPEAADEITRLRAEVERLREALGDIIMVYHHDFAQPAPKPVTIARQALQETGDDD